MILQLPPACVSEEADLRLEFQFEFETLRVRGSSQSLSVAQTELAGTIGIKKQVSISLSFHSQQCVALEIGLVSGRRDEPLAAV